MAKRVLSSEVFKQVQLKAPSLDQDNILQLLQDERETIYISGPFTAPTPEGVEKNIQRAVEAGTKLISKGKAPLIPHANNGGIHLYEPSLSWIDYITKVDLPLLKACQSIYMLKGWENSPGAIVEYYMAKFWGKKIYFE